MVWLSGVAGLMVRFRFVASKFRKVPNTALVYLRCDRRLRLALCVCGLRFIVKVSSALPHHSKSYSL